MRKAIWKPPPNGWVKLNFDVVVREEKTSLAIVGRANKGDLIFVWIKQVRLGSPLVVKQRPHFVSSRKPLIKDSQKLLWKGILEM